jgi:ADP-ribosyl-[dinitrogen reductase] hydrolase
MNTYERFRGAILGLAIGDAFGAPVEGAEPGTFGPVTEIAGGGGLATGEWTDDTAMALCLAESIIACRGFDPVDQMDRYLRWYREGYMSATGSCVGIGGTTRASIERYAATGKAFAGSDDPSTAGNGSLMRLAPVPLYWWKRPELAVHFAAESSRTTHAAREAIDACRFFAALIAGALLGAPKNELLSAHYAPASVDWNDAPLAASIAEVSAGSFKRRQPPEIVSTGHVVRTLEAALWAFHRGESFEEGLRLVVNLGGDADTAGAVYGQLAGAFHGAEAIPARWIAALARRDAIESAAERLYAAQN